MIPDYFGSPDSQCGKSHRQRANNSSPSSAHHFDHQSTSLMQTQSGAIVRNAVQGFFKVVAHDSHQQERNPFLPEKISTDMLLEKHSSALRRVSLTPAEVQQVLDSPGQFETIQRELRARNCQTDGVAKHIGRHLVHKCWKDMQSQQQSQDMASRAKQRQLEIAKELAEARIKARQALNLSLEKEDDDEDDDDSSMVNSELASPTSVTAIMHIDRDKIGTFKPGLTCEEDNSEDGDIQEVE